MFHVFRHASEQHKCDCDYVFGNRRTVRACAVGQEYVIGENSRNTVLFHTGETAGDPLEIRHFLCELGSRSVEYFTVCDVTFRGFFISEKFDGESCFVRSSLYLGNMISGESDKIVCDAYFVFHVCSPCFQVIVPGSY